MPRMLQHTGPIMTGTPNVEALAAGLSNESIMVDVRSHGAIDHQHAAAIGLHIPTATDRGRNCASHRLRDNAVAAPPV